MESQTKSCQNCKKDFVIEPDDFAFYEKIKVPAPTFCPECRAQRRMAWRNDRALYKRNCSLCDKDMISMYPADSVFPVYCNNCWWGDGWDATQYGRDYDFSKPFFKQLKELSLVVPKMGLFQRNVYNSPYSNMCGECRNVYLSVSVVLGSENVYYSKSVDKSFNIFDSLNVKESDNCYEVIEGERNYNCQHLLLSRDCFDSYFLVDCVNCSNCFMSCNLRNKKYCIRNKQYTKEEYDAEILKIDLKNRNIRNKLLNEFSELSNKAIYRYANMVKAVISTGNSLFNVKNCRNCFEVCNSENLKYCYRCLNNSKDSMDVFFGANSEMLYEYTTGSLNDYNVKFSYAALNQVRDADYVESCLSGKNLFGCISIKNQDNVILNKVYSKEEYTKLRKEIIKQMSEIPYVDAKGSIYKYGEFFPIETSPFAYNETVAQEFFPLLKDEVIYHGYNWKNQEQKTFSITIKAGEIPEDLATIGDSILSEVLECADKGKCNHQCMGAFKIVKDEFNFYKKNNIPLPRKCSNCRHFERFNKIPMFQLWHRKCMREGCTNEFETSYAPDRPEIVYCESCYQNEVA